MRLLAPPAASWPKVQAAATWAAAATQACLLGRPHPRPAAAGALGSPGFVAPEVVLREPHTPAMDVFSLGVVLFIMLVGRKPFSVKQCECLSYADIRLADAPGLADARCSPGAARATCRACSRAAQPTPGPQARCQVSRAGRGGVRGLLQALVQVPAAVRRRQAAADGHDVLRPIPAHAHP